MSENKKAELTVSEDAASKNFSTENKISGGCEKCGCEVLIHYHYDDGKPVPNAPFQLTDSNKAVIKGKTDVNGLCLIYDMGCYGYELLIEEGSDDFTPRETVENNPTLQANPDHARLAGEYFTLFLVLRQQGLLEYDESDSSDGFVDVDDAGMLGGIFNSVPDEYRKSYNRFWELDRKINRGSRDLKRAINKIHHSLAAEVADKTGNDNTALLLFCEIALGFIPVVGQAMDVYDIGKWSWDTYEQPALVSDTWHVADGALCAVGLIPGFGDALKKVGRAVVGVLGKAGKASSKDIQLAIRTIRDLSDGNLIKGLSSLRGKLQEYGRQGKALLEKIHAALMKMLAEAGKAGGWLVSLMKQAFAAMVEALSKLIKKYDEAVALISAKIDEFIGMVVTRKTGTPRSKGSHDKKDAHGESQAKESHNAGANKEETPGHEANKQKAKDNNDTNKGDTKDQKQKGDPVDMATGQVVDLKTDFTLGGLLPLEFKRYYRSAGTRHSGLLGRLWRSSWDISLTLDNGVVELLDGEFNQAWFALPNEGEEERAASSPAWRLGREQGQLVLRHLDGTRYRFEHALGKQLCLTAIEDRAGNRINLLWERAALRWLELPDGRLVHVETTHNRITALTLCDADRHPLKTLASYRYDAQGYLLSVRAEEGRSYDYRWSPEGWMLRWDDLSQTWVEHIYDEQGRATGGSTSGGFWSGRFIWDDENLTSHYYSDFKGVTTYIRDERNNILCQRAPDGGETHYEWVDNQLMARTDPLGNRTEFTRNDWGQIVTATLADGAVHRYDYDDAGQLLAYTNPLGSSWCYERNHLGQVVTTLDPEGRRWLYEWNAQGQLASATAPDGSLQRWHYNARGLLDRIEPAGAPAATFYWDTQDRLFERHIAHESGTLIRRWEYHGNRSTPARVVYEDGTETRFSYDIEGNLTTVVDALGQNHLFRYGAFDNLVEATDPLGATVRYHYNGEAEFAGVTNSHGQTWRYSFDKSGRLSEEQHYDGRRYQYHYDPAGQLSQRRAPDGSELHYGYDVVGRVNEISALRPDGSTEGITTLSYDLAGQLLAATGPDAQVEYEWSPSGQLLAERVNGREIASGYDEAGQRTAIVGQLSALGLSWHQGRLATLSIGSHQPLNFSHNAQGYEQQRSNGQGFALQHEWSPTGLLKRQALTIDGGEVNDVLERRYQYDALDRLTGVQDSHWGIQQFRLNGTGQITAERRMAAKSKQTRLFGYDSEQNLCELATLAPDGVTRETQQAHYDVAGRVIRRGDGQYEYDACGRLVVKRRTPAGFRPQETRYEWDAHDRLVRIHLPDGARWRYRYDCFGRRVSKAREGSLSSLTAVEKVEYQWDGDQLVGQQRYLADGSAARETQWIYEPGSFRPLAQVEGQPGNTRLHYIVTDLTGTARELCSEEGDVHWRGDQQLWGLHQETRTPMALRRFIGDAANDETGCDLRYQGQLYDAESGLYYNRHRYYDPEIGQYISPDPIGLGGGLRPQGYVHNPVEWVDPFGLEKKEPQHRSKNAEEMADELADEINKNSVNFSTTDSMGHIDLRGRAHFDKATQTDIPTPHVQTSQVNDVPGKGRFPLKKTEVARAATKQDIRTARKLAKIQGLL